MSWRPRQIYRYFKVFLWKKNGFIEIYFIHHRNHPFRVSSVFFIRYSIKKCHHNLIIEHFITPKRNPIPISNEVMNTLKNQFPFLKSLPKIALPVNLSVVGVLDLFLISSPLPSQFPILIFPQRGLENTSCSQHSYHTVQEYGKKFHSKYMASMPPLSRCHPPMPGFSDFPCL